MKTLDEIFEEVCDAWSSRELFDERIEICKNCIFYNKTLMQCTECKCWVPLKAHIVHFHCPKEQW